MNTNPTDQQRDGQPGNDGKGPTRDWTQVEWMLVTDPVERAFTIQMPKGWHNEAYLYRPYGLDRPLVTTTTPDGQTVIYLGDPNIPNFLDPSGWMGYTNPMQRVARFVPAEFFFRDYVQGKFGNLPGFRITRTGPSPRYHQHFVETSRRYNANFHITTVSISFDYTANGEPRHNLINGCTFALDAIWMADVYGISTNGDPEQYQDLALKMVTTLLTNQQWQQQKRVMSDQMHEQQMQSLRTSQQILQSNHQQNMANLHAQGNAHQTRMRNLHDSFDAANQQWMDNQRQNDYQHHQYQNNQASNDLNHERFLNGIREENTVMDQQGNTFQVDNKHERYYVNKLDNTYIGTDKATELNDLARLKGIDVRNYEEVKIVR